MAVMVAVTDSAEGEYAFTFAGQEAQRLGTELVVVNLTLGTLDTSGAPEGVPTRISDRRSGLDQAETVLAALDEAGDTIDRLVIGVRRRSPVAKAVVGSTSQRLLLEADVPVLAVKVPRNH
jgi:nucleotide-binding universal stress UspA family protein